MTLRQRLLLLLLGPIAVLIFVGGIADYHIAKRPANAAYDEALSDSAVALANYVHVKDGRLIADLSPQAASVVRADQSDRIFFSILGPEGQLIAGDTGMPAPPAEVNGLRHFDATYRGMPVRQVSYRVTGAAGAITVQVAETTRKREALREKLVTAMIAPNLLLAGATLVIVFYGVQRGLSPLHRLQREIESRTPKDLKPLDETHVPGEARALVFSLNRLFDLLRAAVDAQQRFLANAAHQLRTPLAGLQTQLEVVQNELATQTARSAIAPLRDSVKRLTHLTNQLLALARAEPAASHAGSFQQVDLQELVEESASTYLDRALNKEIDLGFEVAVAPMQATPWLLKELLSNLIDNAINYTQRGGRVTVRCGQRKGFSFLEVEDNGPGIPREARDQVMARFYRLPGTAGEGSGLGLAIVHEIAAAHDARVEIAMPKQGHGTLVSVLFPMHEPMTVN